MFTSEQLVFYGIYELQVLENVLRTNASHFGHYEAVTTVADRIKLKIGYVGAVDDSERFLRDFYAAQRAHLEQKMLFGQRIEDKYSKQK